MKIAVLLLGITSVYSFAGNAHAGQFVVPPVDHLVTSIPGPIPAPQPVTPPIYSDSTGDYKCTLGKAMSSGSDYKAFIEKYGAGQPDPSRLPAWSANLPDPHLPVNVVRPAYVSVMVALKTNGHVGDAIVECSTEAGLDASVLAAIEAAKFHPAMKDDQFVASLERVEYWIVRR
jgi:Gram-negative bacterial TonB protein C-terminal